MGIAMLSVPLRWAVVLPCDFRNPTASRKFELAIYPDLQAAQPRVIIALRKVNIEEPKFNQTDPALVIEDKASKTRYKFLSAYEGDKQLQWFYNACRGISQHNSYVPVAPLGAAPTPNPSHQSSSIPATSVPPHAPVPEDVQLAMSINASFQSALAEGVPVPSAQPVNLTADTNGWDPTSENTSYNGWAQSSGAPLPPKLEPTPDPYNRWSGVRPSSSSPQLHTSRLEIPTVLPSAYTAPPAVSVPSAPPIVEETFYGSPIHYPTVDSSPVDQTAPAVGSKPEPVDSKEGSSSGASSSCVICLDAPVEGACIPCGHMAGCMSCLKEIQGKKWGCPVCRAKIDQVIRPYTCCL